MKIMFTAFLNGIVSQADIRNPLRYMLITE